MSKRTDKCANYPQITAGMALLCSALVPSIGQASLNWEPVDGLKVDWTNTLHYSAGFRVNDRDSKLLANPNLDDGDSNFHRGLISNRFELFSELNAVTDSGFGARLSAMGWYDTVYNRDNDNPGIDSNHSPHDPNAFPSSTRRLEGSTAEIRDAFLFGRYQIGDTQLTARVGQHALVWGESLFFASNGIAGAQSAFDVTRLIADPTAEAKDFVLPVPQVSGQLQLTDDLSIGAYYQLRYRPNRIPSVGSYFSVSDVVGAGAEQLLLGPGLSAPRGPDRQPSNAGQFGLQLHWQVGGYDLGLYALRYHEKDLQQVSVLGEAFPGVVLPTSYYLTYNEYSYLYGFSASRTFGALNLAMEASIRKNQALASSNAVDTSNLGGPATDNNDNPAYAVGNTAHMNISGIWSVPRTPLWNEANLVSEVAWTHLLSCTKNCGSADSGGSLDPNASKNSYSLRTVFTPEYRQVISGLDIGIPIGFGFTPKGSRNILGPAAYPATGGGDATLGVNGVYMNAWNISAAYTHFYGAGGTFLTQSNAYSYLQARKDRDFVSLSVKYSF